MGLAEKRLMASIENDYVTKANAELKAAGLATVIELDADSLQADIKALEEVRSRALPYTVRALVRIAQDDLGKSAIQKKIKRVRIAQLADAAKRSCVIKNDQLVIACPWDTSDRFDENQIGKSVEDQL